MRLLFSLLIFVGIGFAIIFIGKLATPPIYLNKITIKKLPDLLVKNFVLDNQSWTLLGKSGQYIKAKSVFKIIQPNCTMKKENKYIFIGDKGKYFIKKNAINLENNVKILIKDYIYYLSFLDYDLDTSKFTTKGLVKILLSTNGEMYSHNMIGNTNKEIFRGYKTKGNMSDLKFEADISSFLFSEKKIVLRKNAKILNEDFNAKADTIILDHESGKIKKIVLTKDVFFKFSKDSKINTAKSLSATILKEKNNLYLYDDVDIRFKNGDKINGKTVIIDLKTGDIDIKNIQGTLNVKELSSE